MKHTQAHRLVAKVNNISVLLNGWIKISNSMSKRTKLELVVLDVILRVFLSKWKKLLFVLKMCAKRFVLKVTAALLGPERWYHYNSAITTMKDVIIRTDPRNELIGLHNLCFYLEETFTISLTCPQGPKCTQPLTSQLVNECSLFFCQTTPTSRDKIEKVR